MEAECGSHQPSWVGGLSSPLLDTTLGTLWQVLPNSCWWHIPQEQANTATAQTTGVYATEVFIEHLILTMDIPRHWGYRQKPSSKGLNPALKKTGDK